MKVKLKIFSKCSSNIRLNNLQRTCDCDRASRNKACWCEGPNGTFSLPTYNAECHLQLALPTSKHNDGVIWDQSQVTVKGSQVTQMADGVWPREV